MDICKVDGCNNKKYVNGLCSAHYLRLRRYGRLHVIVDLSGLRNKFPKEHNSYRAMKNRCICKTDKSYPRWGGNGITICARWLEKPNGFKNFLEDMGRRPDGTTLDRIDNDRGYSPDNCRWATPYEQVANTGRLSGRIPGVHYVKARGKWEANFKKGDLRLTRSFPTKERAIEQRKVWEKQFLSNYDEDRRSDRALSVTSEPPLDSILPSNS